MKKERTRRRKAEMKTEYDFRDGERGKYARRYAKGTNVVVLAPDVAKLFPDSDSVNKALRACGEILKARSRKKGV